MMNLQDLMRELSSRLGIDEIPLNQDGGGQIVVDDEFAIDIARDEEGRGFQFAATVGPVPQHEREAVFAELLEANLIGQGTAGAALALDREMDEIVLCRSIRQDELPFEAFEQELSDFVQVLRFWRKRHQAGQLAQSTDPESTAEAGHLKEVIAPNMLRI